MIPRLTLFSKQYLGNKNKHYSIRLLEKYTQSEFYPQKPFKPDLKMVRQQIGQLKTKQNLVKRTLHKLGLMNSTLIIIQLLAIFYFTFNYQLSAYDGILVSLFPLICASFILMLLRYLNHHFMEVEKANHQLIKSTYHFLFVSSQIFSYLGFRLNSIEIKLNLHQQIWISYLYLGFFIVSSAVIIFTMFGLLLVPYISNFKN
jgi:hypothetical protein